MQKPQLFVTVTSYDFIKTCQQHKTGKTFSHKMSSKRNAATGRGGQSSPLCNSEAKFTEVSLPSHSLGIKFN